MVVRSGQHAVSLEEVVRVQAGGLLAPRRRVAQDGIRRAVVVCDVARHYGSGGRATTADDFATYRRFWKEGDVLWARFSGALRTELLDAHCGSARASDPVRALYAWIEVDDLVREEPVLRAATLYWGLPLLHPAPPDRPPIDAVVAHELRAGRIDAKGLLVLPDSQRGREVLSTRGHPVSSADWSGNLTHLYWEFCRGTARALGELEDPLVRYQDREDRLPWMMVRPPDALDRAIFDIVERLGSARSRDILEHLHDPPPLRTLQRRLRRLCEHGLLIKHGARKDAFYRIAERP